MNSRDVMIVVLFQKGGKCFWYPGNQIVRSRRIRAFNENIVIGIAGHFEAAAGGYQSAVVLDELQELLAQPLAEGQFRAGKHVGILFEEWFGDVERGGLGNRQQKRGALQAIRLERGGHEGCSCRGQDVAEASAFLLLRAGSFDNLIDLARREPCSYRSVSLRPR